ncbi:copper resistance protein CopC [Rhodococcus rhodochrous]|uniref:copper resistance protein CopC n=1 Tax=Rhodococcus rhodochrous TaxID=1829 RepID=UPI0002F23B72|nr:copper resistance protein CopC [Rhodococcus rhodochrous]
MSVALDGLAAGPYTVAFRVTSADGHPISGTTIFILIDVPLYSSPHTTRGPAAP